MNSGVVCGFVQPVDFRIKGHAATSAAERHGLSTAGNKLEDYNLFFVHSFVLLLPSFKTPPLRLLVLTHFKKDSVATPVSAGELNFKAVLRLLV